MFAKIRFTGSPIPADFGSDIVAVLTGETDKNNLSSAVLPGGTEISSVYPAGWTVWDSDTGTADEWVLRAPCDGDATQYKYLKLRFVGGSYAYCYYTLMEDWNTTTNTATNPVTEKFIQMVRFPVESQGDFTQIFYLIATNRYIMMRNTGSLFTTSFPCVELTRLHPCLGIGNGYLPAVQLQNNPTSNSSFSTFVAQMPRLIDDAGTTDDTNVQLRLQTTSSRPLSVSGEFDQMLVDVAYDSVGTIHHAIHCMLIERDDFYGGLIGTSDISKLYMMQAAAVTGLEDQTLHTLDATDDMRIMWDTTNNIVGHGLGRYVIQAE